LQLTCWIVATASITENIAMLGPNDLVICSGTLMQRGFRALCEAGAAGGFAGITLWPQDVEQARAEGLSEADQRAMLRDSGLVVADLDPLLGWLPDEPVPAGIGASEDVFYAIADSLGARSLNVAQPFGDTIEFGAASEAFAGVCERAAAHGLLVTLEYLPWSGIPDAVSALAIVEAARHPNGTLMFDSWHSFRGPTDEAQLRQIPGSRFGGVQISDAPEEPAKDILQETMEARLLPGEGAVPLVDWIRLLDESGSQAPIGVEVFSQELAALPPAEVGRRCGEAARRILREARPGPGG
jgi:sugar phosphate isomerase/epimerase